MTREKFSEILKEYGFNGAQIKLLWDTRPDEGLTEKRLRETAKHIAPKKDQLIQA